MAQLNLLLRTGLPRPAGPKGTSLSPVAGAHWDLFLEELTRKKQPEEDMSSMLSFMCVALVCDLCTRTETALACRFGRESAHPDEAEWPMVESRPGWGCAPASAAARL